MTERLNVLAIARLEDGEVRAIEQVDARIALRCSINREETVELLAEADVLVSSYKLEIDITQAPRLKWVHFLATGLDHLLRCRHCQRQLTWDGARMSASVLCERPGGHEPVMNLPSSDVTITTSSGVPAVPIAEYVLATMLEFARRLPMMRKAQAEQRWLAPNDVVSRELYGGTLGIVGMGHIGERVAHLARAFDMRILATRRSTKTTISGPAAAPADEIYPADRLHDLLAASDYVVLALPLTPESEGLIGEAELRTMRANAVLINIARGRVVDEAALQRVLEEGTIAGAVLDVVGQEPVPAESPLWRLPNVFVTPHISAVTGPYSDRAVELFCHNLRRYVGGEALLNVFERGRGY